MTDVRTMRSYLDLIDERDLALGMATDLFHALEGALACLAEAVDAWDEARNALARAEDRARSAERPDPFHGHHPEHPTPQEAAQ